MQSIWGKQNIFLCIYINEYDILFNALNEKYIFGIWPS